MNKKMTPIRCLIFCLVPLFVFTVTVSCKKPETPQQKQDAFMQEWRVMAQESQGYSPVAERQLIDLGEVIEEVEERVEPEPERPLPTSRVSLRLRETPIVSILRALARAADQNIIVNPTVQGWTSVNLRNVPWDQAFRGMLNTHGLAYTWEGDIIRIMTIQDMQHELNLAAMQERRDAQRIELSRVAPLKSQVIKVNFTNPEELRDTLLNTLTKSSDGEVRGSVLVDRHSNSLVVQATRADLERIGRMVSILDRPRPQVLIEATIVEATKDAARELGMQWSGRYLTRGPSFLNRGQQHGITNNLDPNNLSAATGTATNINTFDADGNPAASTMGLMFGTFDGSYLNLSLRAFQQDGKLNVLSQPSITTMDNQMAYTENGSRIPVVTVEDGDRTVRYENAVLRLEITPNVIDNNNLRMAISVRKDDVDRSRSVDGNPYIITKQTETNLNVGNGETIVISGLTRETIRDTVGGVPGLKDAPGIGRLFRVDKKGNDMEEVLIFLTPTILPERFTVRDSNN